jgi:hypothetical protein
VFGEEALSDSSPVQPFIAQLIPTPRIRFTSASEAIRNSCCRFLCLLWWQNHTSHRTNVANAEMQSTYFSSACWVLASGFWLITIVILNR